MNISLKRQLDEAIDRVLLHLGSPAMLALWVKGANPRLWYGVADPLALLGLAGLIRLRAAKRAPDPAQLPLPGWEHIPVPMFRMSLEEYRKKRFWFEAWLDGQERRSKADRQRLAEMKRFERECAPFCAGVPGMLMEEAWEAKQRHVKKPRIRQRKQAIAARWGGTKNQ